MTISARKISRRLAALLCVAGLLVAGARLTHNRKAQKNEAPRYGLAPTPVSVATTRRGNLEITRDYLAVVEPAQTATLSVRLTSPVVSVAVDEGDSVREGQPLVLLDSREIEDAIRVVEAQMDQVRSELDANEATADALAKSKAYWSREADRVEGLRSEGVVAASQAEGLIDRADQIEGQVDAASKKSQALGHQIRSLRAKVDELRTRLAYCSIASPFDGVVVRCAVDPGDLASPGKALLVVEDRSRLRLAFDVPQRDVPSVQTGMTVRFSDSGVEREGVLTHLFPSLNASRMLRAEAALDAATTGALTTGAYVPVTLAVRRLQDVTLAPASALVESPDGRPHVFALAEGRLRSVELTVLGRSGDDVAVDGLGEGVEVAASTFLGWSRLSAGLAVEAVQ